MWTGIGTGTSGVVIAAFAALAAVLLSAGVYLVYIARDVLSEAALQMALATGLVRPLVSDSQDRRLPCRSLGKTSQNPSRCGLIPTVRRPAVRPGKLAVFDGDARTAGSDRQDPLERDEG